MWDSKGRNELRDEHCQNEWSKINMVGQRNEGSLAWLVIVGCECGGAEKCLERKRETTLCSYLED